MRDWSGKRYWLIGASEGLGREVAFALSRRGVELVLSARSEARLAELALALPGRARALPVDVSDQASVEAAAATLGEIDGIVYLAGAYWPMKATEWDTGKAIAMMDINVNGALRALGAVLPGMIARGAGHIVLTGSLSAYRGLPGAVGYSASKAAMASLADTLDLDLAGTGVEVQVIHPGFIRTQLTDKNAFEMPQIMEPEVAARHLVDQMDSGRFHGAFPAPFAWVFRVAPVLPLWLYRRLFGSA